MRVKLNLNSRTLKRMFMLDIKLKKLIPANFLEIFSNCEKEWSVKRL